MINIQIPEELHICDSCGQLASGDCKDCMPLRDCYDAQYHAWRAAKLFRELPRDVRPDDGIAWDGLGAMRGAAMLIRWTTIAALVLFVGSIGARWLWSR